MYNFEQFFSAEDIAVLGSMAAIFGVVLLFTSALGIVCYVFQSIGLYKMAKSLNLDHPWMAWVPVLNTYTFGTIASKYIKKDGKPSAKFGGWLVGLDIATIVCAIGLIVSVVTTVISAIGMESMETTAPTAVFLGSVLSLIGVYVILMGVAVAFSILYYIALWRIFAIFDNSNATVFLIVSIIFGIAMPFLLFAVRNNKPDVTYFDRIGYIPPPQTDNE